MTPDYTLTDADVTKLYDLLPQTEKDELQPAFRNILPDPTTDVIARLTFDRILRMTYGAIVGAQHRMLDEPRHAGAEKESATSNE